MPPLGLAKGGHNFFKGGQCPPLGGAVKYPVSHLFNLNSPYTTMSYSEFCNRWSCTHEDVS